MLVSFTSIRETGWLERQSKVIDNFFSGVSKILRQRRKRLGMFPGKPLKFAGKRYGFTHHEATEEEP